MDTEFESIMKELTHNRNSSKTGTFYEKHIEDREVIESILGMKNKPQPKKR